MLSLSSSPVCRKRKSNPKTSFNSNKRARLVGIFEPRCIVPTGARRSWTYAKEPRFILDPVTQGTKRSLIEDGELPISSNCKARVLDNRDVLFLPSYKRLSSPQKPQRKRVSISSPAKKSVGFVRLRRQEFIRKRQLQRVDSGICMEYDEDLGLDILFEPMAFEEDFKLFDGVDVSTFTGFSVEMMETTETATEDDMEIEDTSISTTTTAASTTESDADSDPTVAEQVTSSKDVDKKEESEKEMLIDEKKEKEEEKESGSDLEVEDVEKKISEQKEANTTLSSKDTAVKERIRKRLGDDELVRLGPSDSKKGEAKKAEEDDEEDEEPSKRLARRKSSKLSLPMTVEEEAEEDEKEREDDDVVVVKRRLSRTLKGKDEEEKEKEDESEKGTKKEETKEIKKSVRQKAKVEESGSESDGKEGDEKKLKKKVLKEEEKIEIEEEQTGDKMEEDTDEDSNSSGEDTDMSTDEDITDAIAGDITIVEETIEEDVTMSEDDEMAEEFLEEVSEKKTTKEEVDAETTAKDTEEAKDVEVTTSEEAESHEENQEKLLQAAAASVSAEVKKSVRRLVLAPSKQDELEAAKMLSVPRTPRTPRSPNMSRFNITMSRAPRKLNPLINPLVSPRRSKFNKSEDLSAHWTMKRLAAKKRQQPFNPANISRHAYRDSANEDELYSLTGRKALWEDDEAEEAYMDEYLSVEWTCTAKSWDGRYGSWMVENGSALMEFCVRKLEGFNMGW